VRFCPWYPLRDAGAHTPAAPSMLQVRMARGLRTYPRGKSAMVHYQYADEARAAALELAERWRGRELWCRHLLEGEGDDGDDSAGDRDGARGDDGDDGDDAREAPGAESPAEPAAADRLAAYCAKLTAEFLRRFGSLPTHDEPTKPQ
jgi:hypothetical protein